MASIRETVNQWRVGASKTTSRQDYDSRPYGTALCQTYPGLALAMEGDLGQREVFIQFLQDAIHRGSVPMIYVAARIVAASPQFLDDAEPLPTTALGMLRRGWLYDAPRFRPQYEALAKMVEENIDDGVDITEG